MKKRIIVFSILIVICVITVALVSVLFKNKEGNKNFEINSNDKYIFTTDLKYMTMQNDGGSNTSQYYEVDLENKIIYKCQDRYIGFKGYEYKGKILKEISINENEAQKIKGIFEQIINDKDSEKDLSITNYRYYTLTTIDDESIMVNDYDLINGFLNIVDSEMIVEKKYIDNTNDQVQSENTDNTKKEENMKINIKIGDENLTATLVDNTSTQELLKKLDEKGITIKMNDYANMEKVGNLDFDLPRNDTNIQTEAGDIILYQGNSFVIYYDNNSYSLTKLGKIDNIDKNNLKRILGSGEVEVTISKK